MEALPEIFGNLVMANFQPENRHQLLPNMRRYYIRKTSKCFSGKLQH
jgi:hypothetical protein